MATTVALAEALLRRKELQTRLDRMAPLRNQDLFEVKTGRKPAHEGLDDIIAQVPKITFAEFEAEYNFIARQLRLCDAAIQRANWETQITVEFDFMNDRVAPPVLEPAAA
jgi:hypothetical protein